MEKIRTYKGFDKDLRCNGFQYEVGKDYEEKNIKICNRGFHACESPMDVWDHYDMLDSRYCEVEQSGEIQREEDTTNIWSSKIKIIAELKLSDIIKIGIEWILNKTSPKNVKTMNDSGFFTHIGSSGDYAQIGSSGDCVQIGSSGDYARIGSSGDDAHIGSSGISAHIGSSGDSARIGSSGGSARIGSSGDDAHIGSSGDFVQIGSSGVDAHIGSSGDYAQIGSSWYYAQIGSSGDSARIGSSGGSARIGSSGDCVRICSSGDSAHIGSSGDCAKIDSTGDGCVICCAGENSIAKAKVGSWITLSEWVYDDKKGRYIPKCVKTEYVDGERVKGDTWYKLVDGEFKEIKLI